MARNVRIQLYLANMAQDAYGQTTEEPIPWRAVYAEATYSGGSLRTVAGRLAGEHGAVFSTLWMPGIDQCRYVEVGGVMRSIADIVPEHRPGQHRKAHIVTSIGEHSYEE